MVSLNRWKDKVSFSSEISDSFLLEICINVHPASKAEYPTLVKPSRHSRQVLLRGVG